MPDQTLTQLLSGATWPNGYSTSNAMLIVDVTDTRMASSGTDKGITVADFVSHYVSSPPVTSVFGRTSAIVATSGDYSVGQITGAAPTASPSFTGTVTLPTGLTGLVKASLGVVSTATPGTEYLVPSGSGASLTGITGTQITGNISGNAASITGSITNSQVSDLGSWVGSSSITTLGTIATGTIPTSKLSGTVSNSQIAANAVTYAKMQSTSVGSILLGNPTGIAAVPSEITLAGGLGFSGTTLTGVLLAPLASPTFTGSVTLPAGTVTLAEHANLAASSIMGNPTGSPAAPSAVTLAGGLAFSGTTLTGASLSPLAGSTSIVTLGTIATGTVPAANVSGLATSATTDTTSATNITSGTLPAARLPNPTASTLGGVESIAAVSTKFLTSISTSGVPAQSQPAFTDISGTASTAQIPSLPASQITSGQIGVAQGGTNLATLTAHAVVIGEGTSNPGFATIGTAGRVLTDNGAGADPTFQAAVTSSTANATMSGNANIASGSPAYIGSTNITLPVAGTYFLTAACRIGPTITTTVGTQSITVAVDLYDATYPRQVPNTLTLALYLASTVAGTYLSQLTMSIPPVFYTVTGSTSIQLRAGYTTAGSPTVVNCVMLSDSNGYTSISAFRIA